jgi:hypothetical protein
MAVRTIQLSHGKVWAKVRELWSTRLGLNEALTNEPLVLVLGIRHGVDGSV